MIAEKDHEVVAIQVETGKSNTKRNILGLKNHKVDRKAVVVTNKGVEVRVREIVGKVGRDSGIEPEIFFVKNFSLS